MPMAKVICPLHGIRTLGAWQRGLSDLLARHGWICRLDRWSYGRFSLLAFVTPWTREAKLGWLRRQYDAEMNDRRLTLPHGRTPSVVAHCFGTYILGYTLLRFDHIRFDKVILCGSILPPDFPWDRLIERGQVQAVRNEYGVRDPWVTRVRWFVRGTGPSGAVGFTCRHERLEQEEFDFDHSEYFGLDHMEDRWVRFLDRTLPEIPRAAAGPRIPRPTTAPPWGLYAAVLALALLVGTVAAYLYPAWHRTTGKTDLNRVTAAKEKSATSPGPASIPAAQIAELERRAGGVLSDRPAEPPATARTAGPELRGVVFSIEDGQAERKYLPNVLITVADFQVSALTNDQGYFRIRLPAGVLPGQDLTLQENQEGYYILFPVLSRLRMPAKPEQVAEVWMAPKGSKVLFGAGFIEQFIAYTVDDSAKRPEDPKGEAPDLSSYVNELARQSGWPAEKILAEIGRWAAEAKDSDDPWKLGQAAFAEGKFHLAAENFGRAADAEKHRGAEGFRKSAADRTLAGDSYANALDFEKALAAYQAARDDLDVYGRGRDGPRLPTYPEYISDVRDLAIKIANVKGELGVRVAGPDSRRYLEEAVLACRELIARSSRSADPRGWARAQGNLGNALTRLGVRQGGEEGLRSLTAAVDAYHAILEVFTRAALPEGWAATQNNLGSALRSLGERQEGAEGLRSLAAAVEAYRAALEVRTRAALPRSWAMTQSNLGNTLQVLVSRDGFAEGLRRVDRLSNADGLRDDPVAQASLRALAAFAQAASRRDADAARVLGELVAIIERQKDDFRLVWDWSPLRRFLADSRDPVVVARRESLSKLLDALEPGRDRAALLAGLKDLTGAFLGPGAEAAK